MDMAPEYDFTITVSPRRHDITLTHVLSGSNKEFVVLGEQSTTKLTQHMESLTEEQCKMFFKKEKHRG